MAANRFYKPTQWTPNFKPLELPVNMMAKVLTERQHRFDVNSAMLDQNLAWLDKINSMEGFDRDVHNALVDEYQSTAENIASLYEGDLSKAGNELRKFKRQIARDFAPTGVAHALNASYTNYVEAAKSLKDRLEQNKINDADYWFSLDRLKKDYEETGIGLREKPTDKYSVFSPKEVPDRVDINGLLAEFTKGWKADEGPIEYRDGKFWYVTDQVKEVTKPEVYQAAYQYLLKTPGVSGMMQRDFLYSNLDPSTGGSVMEANQNQWAEESMIELDFIKSQAEELRAAGDWKTLKTYLNANGAVTDTSIKNINKWTDNDQKAYEDFVKVIDEKENAITSNPGDEYWADYADNWVSGFINPWAEKVSFRQVTRKRTADWVEQANYKHRLAQQRSLKNWSRQVALEQWKRDEEKIPVPIFDLQTKYLNIKDEEGKDETTILNNVAGYNSTIDYAKKGMLRNIFDAAHQNEFNVYPGVDFGEDAYSNKNNKVFEEWSKGLMEEITTEDILTNSYKIKNMADRYGVDYSVIRDAAVAIDRAQSNIDLLNQKNDLIEEMALKASGISSTDIERYRNKDENVQAGEKLLMSSYNEFMGKVREGIEDKWNNPGWMRSWKSPETRKIKMQAELDALSTQLPYEDYVKAMTGHESTTLGTLNPLGKNINHTIYKLANKISDTNYMPIWKKNEILAVADNNSDEYMDISQLFIEDAGTWNDFDQGYRQWYDDRREISNKIAKSKKELFKKYADRDISIVVSERLYGPEWKEKFDINKEATNEWFKKPETLQNVKLLSIETGKTGTIADHMTNKKIVGKTLANKIKSGEYTWEADNVLSSEITAWNFNGNYYVPVKILDDKGNYAGKTVEFIMDWSQVPSTITDGFMNSPEVKESRYWMDGYRRNLPHRDFTVQNHLYPNKPTTVRITYGNGDSPEEIYTSGSYSISEYDPVKGRYETKLYESKAGSDKIRTTMAKVNLYNELMSYGTPQVAAVRGAEIMLNADVGNETDIMNQLRRAGVSPIAAASILGYVQKETKYRKQPVDPFDLLNADPSAEDELMNLIKMMNPSSF
jgi:hypothetical protein